MIKLIAIDMDNTLLNDQKQVPTNFEAVLDECQRRGITVVIASGRPLNTLKELFGPLATKLSYVTDNGGLVELNGKIIHTSLMDQKTIHEIAHLVKGVDDCCLVYCALDHAYVDRHALIDQDVIGHYYIDLRIVEDLETVMAPVNKVTVYSRSHVVDITESLVRPAFGEQLEVVISDKVWADVMNKQVHKGIGIEALMKALNLKREETMAFGDYFNDVEMLKTVGESYVMTNAPEEMKQYGKHIAKSNNEEGVTQAIIKDVFGGEWHD